MRVIAAGASGVVGRALIPRLIRRDREARTSRCRVPEDPFAPSLCGSPREDAQGCPSGRRTLHDRQTRLTGLRRRLKVRPSPWPRMTRRSIQHLLEEQADSDSRPGRRRRRGTAAITPEKELLGGVGASAVEAGREALSSAAVLHPF